MAYHTLATGEGSGSIVAQLFSAVYGAYFVHEATEGRTNLDLFRVAEAALHDCAVRGKAEGKFTTTTDGMIAIRKILILRDEQLLNSPSYVLADAQARRTAFLTNDLLSPIAPNASLRFARHLSVNFCQAEPYFSDFS
ncbi:hypothetical protein [Burkholderia pseudomallei]|uniref:hypothetical protein n=1 Tax=Burkholderia pseudomallei TaxID=28450 RepID=UPI0005DA5A83|nr:hypothetical protein [Burkholderia pseudomallei]AJX89789.1 hypothetical protein BH02_4956 [Burkholderia pseudomallei]CAK0025630.1 Uncharacterised protein [Burkholderia pseudomallei]